MSKKFTITPASRFRAVPIHLPDRGYFIILAATDDELQKLWSELTTDGVPPLDPAHFATVKISRIFE
jgi:hypothetical protein